ncbi:MAG TPA: helix-turn-helix domain-containing protein [Candidatus Bathyarchaeia archaeon]|nr:helix-turn-helix domain-containing protein [Candidatus Bathyarchaeia archaeon]
MEQSVQKHDEIQDPSRLVLLQVKFAKCPIKTSLGVLGKKWTMLLLRDIGFRRIGRFNRLLESIPGITPRVLSVRLKELEEEGLIGKHVEKDGSQGIVRWSITEKGVDTLPILLRLIAFGSKWYPEETFEDGKRRTFKEIFKPGALEELQEQYPELNLAVPS